MTFYGKLVAGIKGYFISEAGCADVSVPDFIVDIPKCIIPHCDMYSNFTASADIKGKFVFYPDKCSFADDIYEHGELLNLVLKDSIFHEFLSSVVSPENGIAVCEAARKYEAYLRLAASEAKLSGDVSGSMSLSGENRGVILMLAKAEELADSGKTRASGFILKEACRILDKTLNSYECIKTAVILNRPLINAAFILYKKTGGI